MSLPLWWSRPLKAGDSGPDVEVVQRKLGMVVTGVYDDTTASAVRGAQRQVGLEPTGVVYPSTAEALGPQAGDGLVPDWYKGEPLLPGTQHWRLVMGDRDEAWLRRFQGNHGLPPDGVITERVAVLLGALAGAPSLLEV